MELYTQRLYMRQLEAVELVDEMQRAGQALTGPANSVMRNWLPSRCERLRIVKWLGGLILRG